MFSDAEPALLYYVLNKLYKQIATFVKSSYFKSNQPGLSPGP